MGYLLVSVDSLRDADGNATPQIVHWHDGRTWEIERLLHICPSVDLPFESVRYTVLIGGREKYLYQAGKRWYVMAGT